MRISHHDIPAEPSPPGPGKNPRMDRGVKPPDIRVKPPERFVVPAPVFSKPIEDKSDKALTPFERRKRNRRVLTVLAYCVVAAALGFLFLPSGWVNPAPPAAPPAEDIAAVESAREQQAKPQARTAAEWVGLATIGGVRPNRIVLNGKAYAPDTPIPPFNVRWMAREEGRLIFKGPDGAEYYRNYGSSASAAK